IPLTYASYNHCLTPGKAKEPVRMFDDLIIELDPPANRVGKCEGRRERHLTEAAVMLAYGMHLLRTIPDLERLELHPDGEHGKRFEILRWLSGRGFVLIDSQGTRS